MINETVLAVVTHTGFNSKKGELIRCLLFPEQVDFKFYKDAKKFVFLLALLSSLGCQILFMVSFNFQNVKIHLRYDIN